MHFFLWNFSAFLLCSVLVEIFPSLYNFPNAHSILMVTPHTYTLHMDMPLSSMPPTQLMRHFCWGNTCILFTLGNRYISCYATYATYIAFPLKNLHCIYFRKQMHILLCHLHNWCSISAGASPSCLQYETGAYPFMPLTQFMSHVKGIFNGYLMRIWTWVANSISYDNNHYMNAN